MRHNGFIAALPLIFLWSYQFLQLTGLRVRVINNKYLSAIITISIVLGYLLLNVVLSSLITFEKENPLKSQMLNEIVFIQCNSNFPDSSILQNYYDEDLLKIAPNQRNNYLCNQVNLLAHTDDTNAIYENKILKEPETQDNSIKQLWVNNVIAHPFLYLKYRLIVYRTFLRPFDYDDTYYDFLEEQDKNPYSFKLSVDILNPFELNTILRKYLEFTTEHFSLFFRPFFWLITLTVTVLLSILKRNFIIFLVSISGLLYLIFYIPFLPAPDFRYAYYSIFSQTLAILSFLKQKFGLSLKNQSLI